MERLRRLLSPRPDKLPAYQALLAAEEPDYDGLDEVVEEEAAVDPAFRWRDYAIFAMLGVVTLWGWNTFLVAAAYFESCFRSDDRLQRLFQPCFLSLATAIGLGVMVTLQRKQTGASYPFRIRAGLALTVMLFALLTGSTVLPVPQLAYFVFVLAVAAVVNTAATLLQNGSLAMAAGSARPQYMQAVVSGQAIAGVLPAIAQLLLVLWDPSRKDHDGAAPTPVAFAFFSTAVLVAASSWAAFELLMRDTGARERAPTDNADITRSDSDGGDGASGQNSGHVVSEIRLLQQLPWHMAAVFLSFALSVNFPVFTTKIVSVHDHGPTAPALLQSASFIPLAFLVWNVGDLVGRLVTPLLLPEPRAHPSWLLALAVARVGFLPLYYLCNIGDTGAVVPSDFFYLAVVQFGFGLTNGYVAAACFVTAGHYVEPSDRGPAGTMLGLMVMIGLSAGSLLSFVLI